MVFVRHAFTQIILAFSMGDQFGGVKGPIEIFKGSRICHRSYDYFAIVYQISRDDLLMWQLHSEPQLTLTSQILSMALMRARKSYGEPV